MKKIITVITFVSSLFQSAAATAYRNNERMSFALSDGSMWDAPVDSYLFFVNPDFAANPTRALDYIERQYYPRLQEVLRSRKFAGKKGQVCELVVPMGDELKPFVFVGVGEHGTKPSVALEGLRRGLGTGVHKLKKLGVSSALFALPEAGSYGVSGAELLQQLVVAAHMADYEFNQFKTEKKDEKAAGIAFTVKVADVDAAGYQDACNTGSIIGRSMNEGRLCADLPANIATPSYLAQWAQGIADSTGLTCTIFGAERAAELGMGGFLGVDIGSAQPGKFVVLEYKADRGNAPTVALVGKGITFDTGGVSLKPEKFMAGMKYDMSGAAAVIATMNIVAQLKPAVNVVGITPFVENMPDGAAYRQDDILTFMNGKTAEIISTDAEGRLILADGICYAEKFYNPDIILDIATLTGSCVAAYGHFFSGLMTHDDQLRAVLPVIGDYTGDRCWPMPFDNDYKAGNDSDVADLRNCGTSAYNAGAITAGFFLSEFVDKARWAHIDIAGTADGVPGISYVGKGATGAGIRLFVEFLMNYDKYMSA